MSARPPITLILVSLLFILGGCSPWVRPEQANRTAFLPLEAGHTLRQTFTARYNGLQGLHLYLQPLEAGSGRVELRLYSNPERDPLPAIATRSLSEIEAEGWYAFTFPPLHATNQQDYYFEVSLVGTGKLRMATAPGDAYLDGALYQDGQPVDSQAAFRLIYSTPQVLAGLLAEGGFWLLRLLAAAALFCLPGWAFLTLFYPPWNERAWSDKIALACGLSLAIYPLFFLWTHLLGLHLGSFYAFLPPILAVVILLYRWFRLGRPIKGFRTMRWNHENTLPELTILVILCFLVFTRFWPTRNLIAPMWGDSLQHTMIARLMVDHHGLFDSWAPYAELTTFTYHFGFHSAVAVFHWLTDLPLPSATLWTGQIINLIAILGLVPLASRLGRNRWAGVVAVLVAGLLAPMPQVYINWGRYTQLTGQAILPAFLFLSWDWMEGKQLDWRTASLVWITLGGLALSHYRVLIFAILFFAAYLLLKLRSPEAWKLIGRILIAGIGGAVLFLPWFIHVFSGYILNSFARQLSTPAGEISPFTRQYNAVGLFSNYLPISLWLLLLISLAWGLWRRETGVALIATWCSLVVLSANPAWLNLPGTGAISNFAVLIAAYIPAGLLLGTSASWLSGNDPQPAPPAPKRQLAWAVALSILVLILGALGVRQRLKDVNIPSHALFTRPDQRAANWIDANLPREARFLVKASFAYGGSFIVGSDGGWWLPLSADRATTIPPLNYGNERGPRQDYRQWVNALQADIQSYGIDHPIVLADLRQRGISHVYIGQRRGAANNPGSSLDPQALLSSPNFKLLYHQDRVYIFELLRNP